jgi:exodeoxyribonuclease V alpha subunit
LQDSLFTLTKSYRFDAEKGIGFLARAVNEGHEEEAIRILRSDRTGQLEWRETENPGEEKGLREEMFAWLQPYFELVHARAPEAECFEAFNRFRLLTPLRSGPGDVEAMNGKIELWLRDRRLIGSGSVWYPGKPLMVTANDYSLGLYNGDIGIALEGDSGTLAICFPGEGGAWRRIAPGRLPEFEAAYASTVHKSQGSEFDNVVLLVPASDSSVINRNLLYTGITRAKQRCQIWGSESAIRAAIRRRPVRGSGLAERLADGSGIVPRTASP